LAPEITEPPYKEEFSDCHGCTIKILDNGYSIVIGAKYMGARVLEHPLKIFIGIGSERGKAPHDYLTLV
jgi:hypothetical protein